jgi:hypothetical protein
MIPPLLVQPRAFVFDAGLDAFGRRFHGARLKSNGFALIAISKTRANDAFYVSCVQKQEIRAAITALLIPNRNVRILILAFPNSMCCLDANGTLICAESLTHATCPREIAWHSLIWSTEHTDVLRARIEWRDAYAECETTRTAIDGIRSVRDSLATTLVENERLENECADLRRKLAESCATICRQTQTNKKLTQSVLLMANKVGRLHHDFVELRSVVALHLDIFKRSMQAVETNQLAQLAKVAIQCAHYFANDRYTSAHFRHNIVRSGAREGLHLDVLATFPLVKAMTMNDDVRLVLGAACQLLDLPVSRNVVWLS